MTRHADPVVIIRPRWLVDAVGDEAREGQEVVLQSGVIAEVRASGAAAPADARVVDLPFSTLMPGLIDCHVHYLIDADRPDSIPAGSRDAGETAVLIGARNAREALASGVTTARSGGASRGLDVPLSIAIENGDIPGPRLLAAGPAITITGGHGQYFGVQVDRIDEMIVAVRRLARDGVRVIKVVASEAAMLSGSRAAVAELNQEELTAITAEARRLQLTVLAHAQSSVAVTAAARAGVDSVEHAFLADEAALRELQASGAFLTPTLTVTDVYSRMPGRTEEVIRRQAEISVRHRESCKTAIRLGIPLVPGTDCGVHGVTPGMLGREIQLLHEHGLRPIQALRAATADAARLLRIDDEVGTIEPGKTADLVAFRGDLTSDLGALTAAEWVFKDGVVVRSPQQDALSTGSRDQNNAYVVALNR